MPALSDVLVHGTRVFGETAVPLLPLLPMLRVKTPGSLLGQLTSTSNSAKLPVVHGV